MFLYFSFYLPYLFLIYFFLIYFQMVTTNLLFFGTVIALIKD